MDTWSSQLGIHLNTCSDKADPPIEYDFSKVKVHRFKDLTLSFWRSIPKGRGDKSIPFKISLEANSTPERPRPCGLIVFGIEMPTPNDNTIDLYYLATAELKITTSSPKII